MDAGNRRRKRRIPPAPEASPKGGQTLIFSPPQVLPVSSSPRVGPGPASRELAMKGGPATAEQTGRAITGAHALMPFTEISRRSKLI